MTDPSLLPCQLKRLGEVGTLEGGGVVAFPNVPIPLRVDFQVEPALLFEDGRKPRVVAPVRFHNHRIVWLLLPQKFIDGILLPAWVPVGPQFRSLLADRGAQQCQTARAQGLRFLHPRDVETFERLDRFRCRVLHPLKDNQSIPRRHNAIVKDLEVSANAQALDLRLDQPFRRLKQALLHLTNADRECARIDQAPLDHQLAEEVAFAGAATAIRAFITRRLQERPEHRRRWNAKCSHQSADQCRPGISRTTSVDGSSWMLSSGMPSPADCGARSTITR